MPSVSGGVRATSIGIAHFGVVVVVTRVLSLASHLVLGWLLVPADLGIYAQASAATNIVFAFRDLGVGRLLVQRPDRFRERSGPAMTTAVTTDILLATATIVIARLVGPGERQIVQVVDLLALALVVSAPSVVYQAGLAATGRFRRLAWLSAASAVARYGVTLVAAVAGAEGVSLAWGALAASLFDSVAGRLSMDHWAPGTSWRRRATSGTGRFLTEHWSAGMWVGFSTLAIAVQTQGDNLVIAWLTNPTVLGLYFFAYQLTVAVSSLFTVGFSNVLLPALAKTEEGAARQSAVERVLRTTAVMASPVAVSAGFVLPVVIVGIWGSKWLAAALPAEVLAVSLGARLLTPVAMAVYQVQGRWRSGALVGAVDGGLIVGAAIVGSVSGEVATVAYAVALVRSVAALGEGILAARLVSLPTLRTLRAVALPPVVTIGAAVPWLLLRSRYVGYDGPLAAQVALALGLATCVGLAHVLFFRTTWVQFVRSVSARER